MDKVVITVLQGSAVTQTVLGGLNIHPPVTNFIQFTCAKNYENWLRENNVIAVKTVCSFWPTWYAIARCYRPSIRPSVTRVEQSKTVEVRDHATFTIEWLYIEQRTLVSSWLTSSRNSKGNMRIGGAK